MDRECRMYADQLSYLSQVRSVWTTVPMTLHKFNPERLECVPEQSVTVSRRRRLEPPK